MKRSRHSSVTSRQQWQDTLLWAIRPDCHQHAHALLERIRTANRVGDTSNIPAPHSRGLHRDAMWENYTENVADWLALDLLSIDLIDPKIAVISVVGELLDFVNPFTANYPLLKQAFEFCRANENIKAVIVRFKTPGGTVSGLHECALALDALAETKLTIAQVDGGCYSAGYYLGAHCGSICCGPTDQLGNIGTVSTLYDVSKMFESDGIRTIVKRTGDIKGIGIFGDVVTPVQEEFIQHIVDAHFAYFKSAVMSGRSMSEEQFAAVSDGRWWLGAEAIDIGIIDRISTLSETVELVKQQI